MLRNFCVLMLIALLEVSQAQRPSYAGIRPPDGLSQKDKYSAPQGTALENFNGLDIVSRFGADPSATRQPVSILPYGASQRPPIGVPLVLPISAYSPDPVPAPVPARVPAVASPSVNVANRFNLDDANVPNRGNNFVTERLPIDARGDRAYVDYLMSLPEANRPFWFLNYKAIEASRNGSISVAAENRPNSFGG